ncbi:hypothetical protein [Sinobaca sp. H24]|uniref:hypothetical protein n=1 Tax=Sinobaca sp. H24 TaxID=2923376 RepID=UPI002079AD15|nr:hypothetical protein [Sinobaca sp. H24]
MIWWQTAVESESTSKDAWAKLIITGLSPELSIAFVTRNINLSDIQTASTVKSILKQYGIT